MAIELNGIISQIAADVSSHYNVPVPLSTIAESEDIKVFYYGAKRIEVLAALSQCLQQIINMN